MAEEEVHKIEREIEPITQSSCLSKGVYHLICGLNLEYTGSFPREDEVVSLLAGKGVIGDHEERIQLLITVAKLSLAQNSDGSMDFVNTVKQLIPFLHYVHKQLMQLTVEEFEEQFGMDLDWTGHKQRILECFKLLKNCDIEPVNVIVSSLLLFAIIERSLGDVYTSYTGFKAPSNLKDLFVSEGIQELLGQEVSLILYALAGPPKSVNLRNVLWHGFVSPCEIPPQYVSFLIFTIATISSRFASIKIERRPLIQLTQLNRLCIFPNVASNKCISAVREQLFASSLFITPTMLPIWKKALQWYEEERYDLVLVLLLPLLEHSLRMGFAHANKCPKRILTAESTTLYTTFDEILAASLPDGTENQLRKEIGDEFLQMLLDVLVYTDGPRLRDRISHGEVELDCIPSEISNHVLSICVAFASCFAPGSMENLSNLTNKSTETTGNSLPMEVAEDSTEKNSATNFLFPCNSKSNVTEVANIQSYSNMELSSNSDIIRQIIFKARNYQSVYHPVAALKSDIKGLSKVIDKWGHIPLPETEFERASDSEVSEVQEVTLKIIRTIFDKGIRLVLNGVAMEAHDLETLLDDGQFSSSISLLCDNIKVPMLYRPRKELEVVSLFGSIIHHCSTASEQVLKITNQRYQQWSKKELRSRQRANYKRLLTLLPLFKNVIKVVLVFILMELPSLQANADDITRAGYVKFLKRCLQSTENMESLSSPSKNKWDECRVVGEQLINIIQTHLS